MTELVRIFIILSFGEPRNVHSDHSIDECMRRYMATHEGNNPLTGYAYNH